MQIHRCPSFDETHSASGLSDARRGERLQSGYKTFRAPVGRVIIGLGYDRNAEVSDALRGCWTLLRISSAILGCRKSRKVCRSKIDPSWFAKPTSALWNSEATRNNPASLASGNA